MTKRRRLANERRRAAREASQRHRLNTPDPLTGGIRPRKQHGMVAFTYDLARRVAVREFRRDQLHHVWALAFPDHVESRVVYQSFVTPSAGIYDALDDPRLRAGLAGLGGFGDLVLVEGYCEHIREEVAIQRNMLNPALLEMFAEIPDGHWVFVYQPGAPVIGDSDEA